jgi:predicted nucleic acid-binding protein
MPSDYRSTYYCFLTTNDVIAVTKEILKEYEGRAKPTKLLLLAFLQSLEYKGKLRSFGRSFVEAGLRRHENIRQVNYPSHTPDRKWIKTAIAVRARYVLSTNDHLLRTAPNRCNSDDIEVVEPFQYTEIRCPN